MKRLMIIFIIPMMIVFGCSKAFEPEIDSPKISTPSTKAATGAQWTCPGKNGLICGMVNSGWQNYCVACGNEFNQPHGFFVTTLINMIKTQIQTTLPGVVGNTDAGSIQLPDMTWTITVPTEWYESTAVVNYYNSKLSSILLLPEYREGFQCAWYRSVRSLYPGKHNESNVERQFDLWKLNYGSNLRSLGQYGIGIIEGSEAAVTAFVDYR